MSKTDDRILVTYRLLGSKEGMFSIFAIMSVKFFCNRRLIKLPSKIFVLGIQNLPTSMFLINQLLLTTYMCWLQDMWSTAANRDTNINCITVSHSTCFVLFVLMLVPGVSFTNTFLFRLLPFHSLKSFYGSVIRNLCSFFSAFGHTILPYHSRQI